MTTVLHIVPDLGLNGAARQLAVLSPLWNQAGLIVQVMPLRRAPLEMQIQGVVRYSVGRGWLDPRRWLDLRQVVRTAPIDIIHAWNLSAAALTAIRIAIGRGPRLIATDMSTTTERRLLARHWQIINDVPLAAGDWPRPDRTATLRELGLPPDARLIVCAGAMEVGKGFIDAVWVFDILKYVYPNLWLAVLGDGSHRDRVKTFAQSLARDDLRVRFTGPRLDAPSLMSLAEMVWVFGERGGRNVAIEAMAMGRPVIGRARRDLADLVGDAGILVPQADRHELARAARRLLDNAAMMEACSVAARARATSHRPDTIARRWVDVYTH